MIVKIHEAKTDRNERIHNSTFMVGYFNIPLSVTDRPKQKVSKDIQDLNTVNRLTLKFTVRPTMEDPFLSSALRTFTTEDQNIGHKIGLSNFKKI